MTKIRREAWQEMFFGKRFRRWAFYFLLFFLGVMTINDVRDLVSAIRMKQVRTSQYIDNPKEANMNIVFNDSIIFPTVTFCMNKEYAFSQFDLPTSNDTDIELEWNLIIEKALANMTNKDAFLKSTWDYRLVVKAYQAIAILNSLERESAPKSARKDIIAFAHGKRFSKSRKLVKFWLETIQKHNVTFTEFQQKVGLETIRRSMRAFSRLSYDADPLPVTVKVTWISLLYLCFQPIMRNGSDFTNIEEQGEFLRLVVAHNQTRLTERKTVASLDQHDKCMTLDMHGRATTLARNMEGKGRVRDGVTEELCMGMRHEVRVDVRAAYIMLPNKEKSTACRNYDDGDESEFDCRSRCRKEMLQQMCLCTGLTLQYLADKDDLETFPLCDYEKCGTRAEQNFTDQLCAEKCLPDCVQMRYNVQVDQKGHSLIPELTTVTLFWGSFEYLKLEQQYVWNVTTFIAALGGSIGMWLGLSALSLIQFVMYLAGKFTVKVKQKITVAPLERPQIPYNQATSAVPFSANPFGGPVVTNPFDSPFSDEINGKKSSIVPPAQAS